MKEDKRLFCPATTEKEAYYYVIFDGAFIEKFGVSICDLRFFVPSWEKEKDPKIQVDDKETSKIYSSPKRAIEKFKELVNEKKRKSGR